MNKQIPRTLVLGLLATLVVLAIIHILTPRPRGGQETALSTPTVQPASYEGSDKCASCHKQVSPDIVNQYASSTMAHAGVRCVDCHVVDRGNPNGKEHEGFFITSSPTPLQCQRCHPAETEWNVSLCLLPFSRLCYFATSGFSDCSWFHAHQRYALRGVRE